MNLDQSLQTLGLRHAAATLEEIIAQAVKEALTPRQIIERVAEAEGTARRAHSHKYRTRKSRLGRALPLADFDFAHPRHIDRHRVDEAFALRFVDEGGTVLFIGHVGTGKTHLAKALVQAALADGHTALFVDARALVHDLAAQETTRALERRLRHYLRPRLLCIDELAYQHAEVRHLDLLYELVRRRYEARRAIVATACLPFAQWPSVMPSTAATAALVDRLVHRAILISIDADSYRRRQAELRNAQ
jgi:DNA replication protein DnaC